MILFRLDLYGDHRTQCWLTAIEPQSLSEVHREAYAGCWILKLMYLMNHISLFLLIFDCHYSQLAKHILPVSKHTRHSSFVTTLKRSRFRSSISLPESPISLLQSRKRQYETTSKHCATTMSNITSIPKFLITHTSTTICGGR